VTKTSESLLVQAEEMEKRAGAMLVGNAHTMPLLELHAKAVANATRTQIAAGLFAIAEAMAERAAPQQGRRR
jgi:hypothetical protein